MRLAWLHKNKLSSSKENTRIRGREVRTIFVFLLVSSFCLSLANPYSDFAFLNEHLYQLSQYQRQGSKGCFQLRSLSLSTKAEVRSLGWLRCWSREHPGHPLGVPFCSFYLSQVLTITIDHHPIPHSPSPIPYLPTPQLASQQNFQHILSVCSSFIPSSGLVMWDFPLFFAVNTIV